MNALKKQIIALSAISGMCACVHSSPSQHLTNEQLPKPLDRANVMVDQKSLDLELRIAVKNEVEKDAVTGKPVLDKGGSEKVIQIPVYQLVVPHDRGTVREEIVVAEMDLLTVHVKFGQRTKHSAALGWDAEDKQFYVACMLSVDNTIYVEVSRAPFSFEGGERVAWKPTGPFAMVTLLGDGISGTHPAVGGRVIPREGGIELEIHREGIAGPPTMLSFDENKRSWSTQGPEMLRQ